VYSYAGLRWLDAEVNYSFFLLGKIKNSTFSKKEFLQFLVVVGTKFNRNIGEKSTQKKIQAKNMWHQTP